MTTGRSRARHLSPVPFTLLLAIGCATVPRPAPSDQDQPFRLTRAESASPDAAAWAPLELAAPLRAFTRRAHLARAKSAGSDQAPATELDNWRGFLAHLDEYLARTGTSDARKGIVRQALEAELERDAHAYGELPPELVDAVLESLDRLSEPVASARPGRASGGALSPMTWPVDPVEVTSPFGWRLNPVTHAHQQHQGVDLAAHHDQPVMAAGDGVVTRAQFGGGYGNVVEVDHGSGVLTRYSHLSSLLVAPGESLERGKVLGLAGRTGRATGTHLHFEIWRDGEARDPLEELGPPSGAAPVAGR